MVESRFFLLVLLFLFPLFVHGQWGFVRLDCGKPSNYTFKDATGIVYTSDSPYVDSGQSRRISPAIGSGVPDRLLQDLRNFPEGKRNCFTLPVTKDASYLVRAYFLYGNYDGLDAAPEFDLYLGTNLWTEVSFQNSSRPEVHEIIAAARGISMQICLVKKASGNPFISALELRLFDDDKAYGVHYRQAISIVGMVNFGARSYVRYPTDKYDRVWTPYIPPGSSAISSSSPMIEEDVLEVPSEVMQTACTPMNFSWPVDRSKGEVDYMLFKHFAELQVLAENESRDFGYWENGVELLTSVIPKYLKPQCWHSERPRPYYRLDFAASMNNGSSLPPMINAMQMYEMRPFDVGDTDAEDVEAMLEIKASYRFRKNWVGDPCAPKEMMWEGLGCLYGVTPFRIISLNLANSGLGGRISPSIAKLRRLQRLDLSANNITGPLPDFLADLPELKFLDLTCNGLNESNIPKVLRDRSEANTLDLVTGPCHPLPLLASSFRKPTKKELETVIPVALVLLVILLLCCCGMCDRDPPPMKVHRNVHTTVPVVVVRTYAIGLSK